MLPFDWLSENRTEKPLKIDWNQTKYLLNGKPNGLFWFRGIDPRSIKGNIPPDIIPGGSHFEKVIFPVKLVAFSPVRNDTLSDGRPGIFPGPMPGGENGISLVVTLNGEKIKEKLVFTITAETMGTILIAADSGNIFRAAFHWIVPLFRKKWMKDGIFS